MRAIVSRVNERVEIHQVIAEVANQHRTHRLDVTGILTEGDNLLEVRFRSPVKYANAQSLKEIESRENPKAKVSLETRFLQAGLNWSRRRYYIFSAITATLPTPTPNVMASGNGVVE